MLKCDVNHTFLYSGVFNLMYISIIYVVSASSVVSARVSSQMYLSVELYIFVCRVNSDEYLRMKSSEKVCSEPLLFS